MKKVHKISAIIPTLNESENIETILAHLVKIDANLEIIVADGQSTDSTAAIARKYAKAVDVPRGRAIQMNTGTTHATGDVFWFLHADCLPHPDSSKHIHNALLDERVAGGAFNYELDHPALYFRITDFFPI